MESPELAAIRAATANQQQQEGAGTEGKDEAAQQAAVEAEKRRALLSAILDTAGRERLNRIALVSQDRARQIEAMLLRLAQTGQLRGRVSEEQLIELLDQIDGTQSTTKSKGGIRYQRKGLDDDFDFDI